MRAVVNRFHLRHVAQWSYESPGCASAASFVFRSKSSMATNFSSSALNSLPELPAAPRYPCPFITCTDIEKYLVPLYLVGWGISRIPAVTKDAKIIPSATQLSKRIPVYNSDLVEAFMKEVEEKIIEVEDHHPTWGKNDVGAYIDVHVHTHTALAPPNRQNVDDNETFRRRRPGITHRDIRFAILFEQLLKDHAWNTLDNQHSISFPHPTDIDSVHNFRPRADENHG